MCYVTVASQVHSVAGRESPAVTKLKLGPLQFCGVSATRTINLDHNLLSAITLCTAYHTISDHLCPMPPGWCCTVWCDGSMCD